MPSLYVSSKSSSSISISISGLENDPSLYGGFRFRAGGSWYETSSTSYTFSGFSANTTYYFNAEAQWDGVWYSAGSCSGTTDSPPPPPSPSPPYNISVSVSGLNVTVYFNQGANTSYSYIDYYWDGIGSGWQTVYGSSHSFTVSSYNTFYQFDMCGVASDGTRSSWTGGSFTTGNPSVPDIPSSYPILTSRGEGSLSLSWGASNGATSYTLKYGYSEITGITSTSYTLSGLEFGTSYNLSVKGVNSQGSSAYTSESTATTAPKTPILSKTHISNNSVQINILGMTGNYDNVQITCYDVNWNVVITQDMYQNQVIVFTGLTQGATYRFQAWSYLTVNGTTLQSASYAEVTVIINSRPLNWSWSYDIQSGGDVYNVIIIGNIIYAYIMPATEFNDFCGRINAFRIYKGLANYSFTSVSSGSDCTPSIINQAVNAINELGFGISTVGSGFPASVFINMRDSLNSII